MSVATALRDDRSAEHGPDRAQATYFIGELQHQLTLIDEEMATLRRRLARCERQQRDHQVKWIQHEMRQAAVQRREVLDMVTALIRRFRP